MLAPVAKDNPWLAAHVMNLRAVRMAMNQRICVLQGCFNGMLIDIHNVIAFDLISFTAFFAETAGKLLAEAERGFL